MCENTECQCKWPSNTLQDDFFALWHATFNERDVRRMKAIIEIAKNSSALD